MAIYYIDELGSPRRGKRFRAGQRPEYQIQIINEPRSGRNIIYYAAIICSSSWDSI